MKGEAFFKKVKGDCLEGFEFAFFNPFLNPLFLALENALEGAFFKSFLGLFFGHGAHEALLFWSRTHQVRDLPQP